MALGKKKQAINDLNQAVKINPRNVKAFCRLSKLKKEYGSLNVSFYQPITQPKHNHEVSLLSMHHIIDFNNLQMLRLVLLFVFHCSRK